MFFHWSWILYVAEYFNEYACKIYLVLDLRAFLVRWFRCTYEDYDERRPRACRWTSGKALLVSTYRRHLDRLTPDMVCWIPYDDHHSFREFEVISLFSSHLIWGPLMVIHWLKRVVWQFGYIQTIFPHLTASSLSAKEIDDRWMQFSEYIAPVGQLCVVPDHFLADYMDWFYMISHPFMSPA